MVGWFAFAGVCAISVLRTGFLRFVDLSTKKFDLIKQIIVFYYDGRFAIPAKLMFWGNILFPAITLLWSGFWLIRKRKTGVSTLLPGLLVCTVLNTVMAASVPALTSRYYLALGAGAINQYLLFLLIDLLFFICCVIYLIQPCQTA